MKPPYNFTKFLFSISSILITLILTSCGTSQTIVRSGDGIYDDENDRRIVVVESAHNSSVNSFSKELEIIDGLKGTDTRNDIEDFNNEELNENSTDNVSRNEVVYEVRRPNNVVINVNPGFYNDWYFNDFYSNRYGFYNRPWRLGFNCRWSFNSCWDPFYNNHLFVGYTPFYYDNWRYRNNFWYRNNYYRNIRRGSNPYRRSYRTRNAYRSNNRYSSTRSRRGYSNTRSNRYSRGTKYNRGRSFNSNGRSSRFRSNGYKSSNSTRSKRYKASTSKRYNKTRNYNPSKTSTRSPRSKDYSKKSYNSSRKSTNRSYRGNSSRSRRSSRGRR